VLIACILEAYTLLAVTVDAKTLDVIKEELLINGTYRLDCMSVLIPCMLEANIFLAVTVDVNTLDVLKEEL
jgi:hypothetical protein